MSEQQKETKANEGRDFVGELVRAVFVRALDGRGLVEFEGEQGFVSLEEIGQELKAGDVLELYVEGVSRNGLWACSAIKVEAVKLMQRLYAIYKKQEDVEVRVVSAEKNGLVCDVLSILGFMPIRQIEASGRTSEMASYVGKTLQARILKISQDRTVIVSHRAAVEKELLASREALLAGLVPEQIFEGRITQVVPFGVFVDIGSGVEGLVHRSNLSWSNAEPAELVSSGDGLRVVVLAVDSGKISLGHKQLVEDTWLASIKDLQTGDVLEGKVTALANFGAFVQLDNKVEGLIHNSELSWLASVRHAKQVLAIDSRVRVKLIGIDEGRRRLKLSLKQVEENPWERAMLAYPTGARVTLPIGGIADFGLFVDMGEGLKGLIHQSDLQWRSQAEEPAYKTGDSIECVVLSIDPGNGRASFGVKQLSTDPWVAFLATKPLGKAFDVTVKRLARFGAFASLDEGIEGLIHISEISSNRIDKIEDVLNVGDAAKVTVVSVDPVRRRLGLSCIAEPFEPETDPSLETAETAQENPRATMADIMPADLIQ